jgi:membrane glycosyltransferase
MELRPATDLNPAGLPMQLCGNYVDRLPLTPSERRELLARAQDGEGDKATIDRIHRALAAADGSCEHAAYASIRRRLELASGAPLQQLTPPPATDRPTPAHLLPSAPPFRRTPMAPRGWLGRRLARLADSVKGARFRPRDRDARGSWHGVGILRRLVLLVLVLMQTLVATHFMAEVLPYNGRQPLEIAILALFAVLFGWISAGFWTAMAGFALLVAGGDRYTVSRSADGQSALPAGARTAIVMPICNEDVTRVFAGLRSTYESLDRTGTLQHFDFFVLSDTGDPDTRVAEINAWHELARATGGFGRIFYRWRRHRIKRKSGNVADFCRRWGAHYRYMVVLDADSVMSGDCLTRLVHLMEANPRAGIIQTAPRAAGRETLYARVQQFATRVYGPVFTTGLHFWQLGESHYWGHNAIIRVAPFIEHCALGRLPGRGSLSGEILSHDFVEAALMRRAGWAVWIAYDLPGSYEEMPPNLVDELKRDRRWCQGNLMNFRLFTLSGLHPAHRAVFMIGVMSYLSAPLWFLALMLATVLLAVHTLHPPQYFVEPYQLFPLWPEWRPEWAVVLFGATATLLILPKVVSVLLICARGAKRFGGAWRLTASMAAELVVSALLAPIRMLFHTQFIVSALAGWSVRWHSPPREDAATAWGEALRRHGWHTLLGVAWVALVYALNPSFLWWLLPVAGALILSIPLSVFSSRVSPGRVLRTERLFLVPEESRPPREIRAVRRHMRCAARPPGFVDAVVDPIVNAFVCAYGTRRAGRSSRLRDERLALARRALECGPAALDAREKSLLLDEPVVLSELHRLVWASPQAHRDWHATARAHPVRGANPLPEKPAHAAARQAVPRLSGTLAPRHGA